MTLSTTPATCRRAFPAAVLAALLLAGCSSGHVGESWQCPLADAGTCDSVAAADPAVPHADAAGNAVLGEPLWRVQASDRYEAGPERSCEADCGGFDPFAWLARLFDVEAAGGEKTAAPGPVRLLPPEAPASAGPSVASVSLPAEPDAPETDDVADVARDDHDNFRTDEVVARIWIAPFVDADGVYREASWVRVVLEPAGWRLER